MTQEYIRFFLTYGYFPKKAIQTIQFDNYSFEYENFSIDELGQEASRLFHENISDLYKSNERHLVPLSGGFDSRGILATLLKFTEAKNIYSYSFGAQNTLDYEIGRNLAQSLGINHISFDLQSYDYSLDDLLYQSSSVNKQTFLFHNPPLQVVDTLFGGFHIWSGIVGDIVAGSAIPKNPSKTMKEAIYNYLKTKKYCKDSLLNSGQEFDDFIFFKSFDQSTKLSLDEKLLFTERYENSYKPHVCPGKQLYLEPFINSKFTDFMFNSPRELHDDFSIYYAMLNHIDSKLFNYPSKKKMGLSINSSEFKVKYMRARSKVRQNFKFEKIPINTNYFDFNIKINSDIKFKQLIKEQIFDLSQRDLVEFMDLKDIFNRYTNGVVSPEMIKTLVALEVHLKNGKKLPNRLEGQC